MANINCVTGSPSICKHVSDDAGYGFVFDAVLKSGDTITSVEDVSIEVKSGEEDSATLVVSDAQPSAAETTDERGATIAAGRAVLANMSGGAAGVVYGVTIVVATTDGETLGGVFLVEVKA